MIKYLSRHALPLALAAIALAAFHFAPDAFASVGPAGVAVPLIGLATLATKWPTLVDLASQTDPNGGVADIAEILNETNEALDDIPWMECNDKTGHRHTVRTGLPAPTWRKLYGGVQPTKATQVQVRDACGMLEDYAEVDASLVSLAKDPRKFRLNEDRAHIEGMSKTFASTLVYGNTDTAPEKFMGLAPRYNSLSAQNADNIVSGGGVGSDNTSIWLVCWGERSAFGIYPEGSNVGLKSTDKGQVTLEDASNGSNTGRMEAFRTHYKWDCGLTVRDWRDIVRIPNIDVSDLGTLANTKNLITWMIQAGERINTFSGKRPVFYVNRTIREKLRLGIIEKISNNLSWETVQGKRVMVFDDIPVKRVDAILNNEAAVS